MIPRSSSTSRIRGRFAVIAAVILGGRFAFAADPPAAVPVIPIAPAPRAAAPAPAPAITFDSFRFIGDGNIFNPYRVGRTSSEAAAPAIETITLVGTMQYDKGMFVFFDSPDGTYRKTLHEGDTIAQFGIKHIAADHVVLTRDSKEISLTMGQQLRRPPGGDWSVGTAPRPDLGPAVAAAPVIPADASDIVRRLMEKRLKQLKQ